MSAGKWVDVPGARLAYTSRGEGPPVVFLHGSTLDRRMWAPQAPLAARWRLVALDLRGHGRSSRPGDEPYSHSADLLAFLDGLGIARAAVVGLSTGGRVAAQFAVEHPTRVSALALLDPAIHGMDFGPELSGLFSRLGPMARDRGMSAAIDFWLDSVLFERARRLPAVEAVLQRIVREYDGSPWLRPNLVIDPSPPTLERLGDLRVPALVLVGEHDHEDFHRVGRACADRIPGAEFTVVRGAGHLVNMEAPETVNAALEVFLSRALA